MSSEGLFLEGSVNISLPQCIQIIVGDKSLNCKQWGHWILFSKLVTEEIPGWDVDDDLVSDLGGEGDFRGTGLGLGGDVSGVASLAEKVAEESSNLPQHQHLQQPILQTHLIKGLWVMLKKPN